ncbi:hypothetical protein AB833_11430 [Chromatiales bacterium (ex Bugula neritina AB1)]|nr:hypothetical protein AB833_11430 [Chromatiales bacterium (ex Bugula neritina AB1)]
MTKLLLVTTLSAFLLACGDPTTVKPTSRAPEAATIPTLELANGLLAEGDIAQAAHVFAQLASKEIDPLQRQEYQLIATELYFDSGLYNDGARMYATFPETLSTEKMQLRRTILAAYYSLAQQKPEQALQALPAVQSLADRMLRIRALEIRARAQQQLGQTDLALKSRILLETNLVTPESIEINHTKINEMLAQLDQPTLQKMVTTPAGSIYRGWLEYTLLTRSQAVISPEIYAQRYQLWQARYPGHPATPTDIDGPLAPLAFTENSISTSEVALLLPLTGQFSQLGEAIKTGFIAARFADGATTSIRLYDTRSDATEAQKQYSIAAAEGATMIIGPLNKAAVINLAASNRITVPTLSLNYVGDGMPGHSNLYQFGLLPEDEARDAAYYTLSNDYKKALVITADSTLGTRLANAFSEAFTGAGGTIIGSEVISEDSYDYSPQLTSLLAIDSSNTRKRRLEQLLGTKLKFEPAIRSDIDAIFMAVNADQARLLRPQLQFHHASKLPVLSTSRIFSGEPDKRADGDLTGIRFNEIPWLLTDARINSPLYSGISQVEQNTSDAIARLTALGIDAYLLHTRLDTMRIDPSFSVSGKTGALTLEEGNRIRRRLEWAEFLEGVPEKISDPLPLPAVLPPVNTEL